MKTLVKRLRNWLQNLLRTPLKAGLFFGGLVIALLLVILLIAPSIHQLARDLGTSGFAGLSLFQEPGEGQTETDGITPTKSVFEFSSQSGPTPEPWDGANRVTILVMGLDYRDWAADEGPSRTDTMILFSIDPLTKTAGILSIPRDLWVNIPGFNPAKINSAYYFGEAYKVPGGGPALAMKTVEQTIGIPIDYYAQIDFGAFERFIDLLGGVKLDIKEPIRVDPLGSKPPRMLEPGIQTLPGDLALAYARNRSTGGGDFERAARQQQVILAIRDRILDFDLLPDLIANAPSIYAELSAGLDTNLPLQDAIRLAILASQIKSEDIKRGIIGEDQIIYGSSPDDLAILIPIPDRIRALRDEVFASSSPYSPFTPGSSQERMNAEAASISVQNGTSSADLGDRTAAYLTGLGVNVSQVTSAEQYYTYTTVIDHRGRPYAVQFLVELMGIQPGAILFQYDPNSPVDVELKLGNDWLNNNSLP